jgi:Na+/H+ antiporter NhaD/arsenite permease-like protein
MMAPSWLPLPLILLTLAGVAIGQYPGLRMNRATIALVGATLLVLAGAMTLEQAYAAIDLDIIVLLFAVMIIGINLGVSGFFRLVIAAVLRRAATPRALLALVVAASGLLSAIFLNDVIVLIFTPLVLETALALRRNPVPYLIGLMTSANIGSVATITGNPQNMLIGVSSGMSYTTFAAALAPVALAGLAVAWIVPVLLYREEFAPRRFAEVPVPETRPYKPLLRKSVVATGAMLIAFMAGMPVPLAALGAATILLITRRLKPARVFRELDWSLLVFFAALFVVTGAVESTGMSRRLFEVARPVAERGVPLLAAVSALLSNLVSNVPAVMLFRPLIPGFADPQRAWLVLAMATTLAGNLTLLGSVANLIVAESAYARGVRVSFMEYLRAGVPVTLATLSIGVLWLMLIA